jgi:hypothetical protein
LKFLPVPWSSLKEFCCFSISENRKYGEGMIAGEHDFQLSDVTDHKNPDTKTEIQKRVSGHAF